MAVLGRACLILALAACAYGIGAALYGARTGRREWAESGRRAVYVLAGLLTVSFAVLELAFVRSDFSFETVATHSSTTTPGFYKAAAVWSSQQGSLLLWACLLAAWFFLGIGILLGARWSYSELGWGGYWAWDPVENASLMPWLTGTAFLHSIIIQEKRGMLKMWNVSLVLATGVLAILGTFLVRSGILDSIHAFGASTLGIPFVAFIALLAAGSIALVVSRRAALRSARRPVS